MKTIIALLTAACGIGVAAEAREFTARDGRSLEAEIVSCDGDRGRVTVRRADGHTIVVKIGAFSPEDQAYIRQWVPVSNFMSDREFPLTVSRIEEKTWRREHESTSGGMGGQSGGQGGGGQGGGGQSGGPGSESSAAVVATDKYERYRYDIKLTNRGPMPLQELDVEYCIYYDQESAVADGSGSQTTQRNSGRQSGPQFGSRQQSFYTAVPEVKVTTGKKHISEIAPNGRFVLPSERVTILNRNASSSAEGELIDLEGRLKGVWVKISMQAPDGTVRTREITLPRSIRQQVEWKNVR